MPPLVIYLLHFDENEVHAASELMIIILDPSLNRIKIKKDALVQLTSVTMQMALVPVHHETHVLQLFLVFRHTSNCHKSDNGQHYEQSDTFWSHITVCGMHKHSSVSDTGDPGFTHQPDDWLHCKGLSWFS